MRANNHILAVIGSICLLTFLAAGIATVLTTVANSYLGYGFYRSILYILADSEGRFRLSASVIVACVAIGSALWIKRGATVGRAVPLLSGAAAGLAFFAGVAYTHNLNDFFKLWHTHRDLMGAKVPEALFRWPVWRANALIALLALAAGLAIWALFRFAVRGGRSPGRRYWHTIGHPAAAAAALALLALPIAASIVVRGKGASRPNFILVSLDTLRADHLGAYGYARNTSPEIDRLAAGSFTFDWAFCQGPRTDFSHTSMFTSLYPTVHGVDLTHSLAGARLTLAEYLREAGYRTAACTDGGYMRRVFGFSQGFERYDDFKMKGMPRAVPRVLGWLDKGLARGPFFLFLHTFDIHSPYEPPKRFQGLFTDPDANSVNTDTQTLSGIRSRVVDDPRAGHGLSDEEIEFMKGRYDEGIRWIDGWVGRLIDGLRERGLLENTWVVILSDHGEEFTEHGTVLHGELYHTNIRVPLIIRPPGWPNRGRRVPQIVELIDVMPTFLDLAGVKPIDRIEGTSLVPLLKGNTEGWKNVAFSEHPGKAGWQRSITTPDLHVITSSIPGDLQVYDYRSDPLEQVNLDDPARTEEVRDLLLALDEWTREQMGLVETWGGAKSLKIDSETEDQLRSLGYIK
jgi:arylsulfatase